MKAHVLGFPRIGVNRELKKSLEAYWSGSIDQSALEQIKNCVSVIGKHNKRRAWTL